MKCPVCGNVLTQTVAGNVTLDVCSGGCGGIWFDQFELKKLDEPHEPAGTLLEGNQKNPQLHAENNRRRNCPKCSNIMLQHFFSAKRKVRIDECPSCGGYWLDVGELAAIRQEFNSEEERRAAAARYCDNMLKDSPLPATDESVESLHRITNIIRFINLG